ncbi:uncharacterized protein METZ01_LOCUS387237, partial [marine metagenome]
MKIEEIYTPEFVEKNRERLDEIAPLLLLIPAVKAAAGFGLRYLAKKGIQKGIQHLAKKGAQSLAKNVTKAGVQGSKTAAQQAHMRALTGGGKIMKGVKKIGQKVNQAPAGADSEAGKFVKDLVSNPTGAPVDAPAGTSGTPAPAPTAPATPA